MFTAALNIPLLQQSVDIAGFIEFDAYFSGKLKKRKILPKCFPKTIWEEPRKNSNAAEPLLGCGRYRRELKRILEF